MYAGLIKTSLIDFPNHIASVVFLPGCNMRCPYCYNKDLVSGIQSEAYKVSDGLMPLEHIYAHIEKRKQVLEGVVFTGGEALLSPELPGLIKYVRKRNLAVKLDTNGLLPERLSSFLADELLCPDMIALDIKTALSRYTELLPPSMPLCGNAEALVRRTVALLQKTDWPRRIEVEFRTVLVPPLVGVQEIHAIAAELPHHAQWFFSRFLPGTCLNPDWNRIVPYTVKEMKALVHEAQCLIPSALLRM